MPSLIQKHAHVKGQRSNHHIFKFQPNPSWAKKQPNRYTSFAINSMITHQSQAISIENTLIYLANWRVCTVAADFVI